MVLNILPDWFGFPESTAKYISDCRELPFWAYFSEACPQGFIALKQTGEVSAKIYVMGVLPQIHRHRHGIGTALWNAFLQYAENNGYEYVQVKTVQSGHYKGYDITNKFYKSLGFCELECLPALWGAENPCQIYIKYIPINRADGGM